MPHRWRRRRPGGRPNERRSRTASTERRHVRGTRHGRPAHRALPERARRHRTSPHAATVLQRRTGDPGSRRRHPETPSRPSSPGRDLRTSSTAARRGPRPSNVPQMPRRGPNARSRNAPRRSGRTTTGPTTDDRTTACRTSGPTRNRRRTTGWTNGPTTDALPTDGLPTNGPTTSGRTTHRRAHRARPAPDESRAARPWPARSERQPWHPDRSPHHRPRRRTHRARGPAPARPGHPGRRRDRRPRRGIRQPGSSRASRADPLRRCSSESLLVFGGHRLIRSAHPPNPHPCPPPDARGPAHPSAPSQTDHTSAGAVSRRSAATDAL